MNIADLKKSLEAAGISTATPGLSGASRFEELKSRYEENLNRIAEERQKTKDVINSAPSFIVPSLNHLTIAELKLRLASLGENTNTPGLTGEHRRNELMKRLIEAICGDNELLDEYVKEKDEDALYLVPVVAFLS